MAGMSDSLGRGMPGWELDGLGVQVLRHGQSREGMTRRGYWLITDFRWSSFLTFFLKKTEALNYLLVFKQCALVLDWRELWCAGYRIPMQKSTIKEPFPSSSSTQTLLSIPLNCISISPLPLSLLSSMVISYGAWAPPAVICTLCALPSTSFSACASLAKPCVAQTSMFLLALLQPACQPWRFLFFFFFFFELRERGPLTRGPPVVIE